MADPKKRSHPAYEALVQDLRDAGHPLSTGSLFGMPCVKAGGKAALGAYDGGVVFKLEGEAHARALALDGAHLFDPSGRGRPMKAWVVVPGEQAAAWPELAREALGVG